GARPVVPPAAALRGQDPHHAAGGLARRRACPGDRYRRGGGARLRVPSPAQGRAARAHAYLAAALFPLQPGPGRAVAPWHATAVLRRSAPGRARPGNGAPAVSKPGSADATDAGGGT